MGNFTDAITIRYTLAEADPGHLLTKSVWAEEHGVLVKQRVANAVWGTQTSIHREIGE